MREPTIEGRIVISKDNFYNNESFRDNLSSTILCLLENEYEALIKCDSVGIYYIDYVSSNREYGGDRFLLVTLEEEEDILDNRCYEDDGDTLGEEYSENE